MEKRIGVFLLGCNVSENTVPVDLEPWLGFAEAGITGTIPLHGRAAAISADGYWPVMLPKWIKYLAILQVDIAHTDLITVIDKRSAALREQHGSRYFQTAVTFAL